MSGGGGEGEDESYVCGADTTTTDDPCQFPVESPGARCPAHPKDGSGPPEGHGTGDPDHHMGSGDGKIQERMPDGAKPNFQHGLNSVEDDPQGTLDWLESQDPRGFDWITSKFKSFMQDAPFTRGTAKADEVLHACLMLYAVRGARHRQVSRGLSEDREITDEGDLVMGSDGEPVKVEQELPVNLPANRIAREARSMLKDLGVLDDPESQKAAAMGGWSDAAREVAQEVDSEPVEADGE